MPRLSDGNDHWEALKWDPLKTKPRGHATVRCVRCRQPTWIVTIDGRGVCGACRGKETERK